jgi:small GTP-binding protein
MDDYDSHYKHIIIGDALSGKSSYLKMLTKKEFSLQGCNTIGVDFETYYTNFNNQRIKNHLWDTAGQEKFRSIVRVYFKGAHSCIIMYDVTNYVSFQNIENWLRELNDEENNFIKILIGNKIDLEKERCISTEIGQELADKYNMEFMEISVKENKGVQESFEMLIKKISKEFKNKKIINYFTIEENKTPKKCLNCNIS